MAETIGSLVDKISIVDLKIYHMKEQAARKDASREHQAQSKQKSSILEEQRSDLISELSELAQDVIDGKKTLKVYRQFKMYNDPIYRSK